MVLSSPPPRSRMELCAGVGVGDLPSDGVEERPSKFLNRGLLRFTKGERTKGLRDMAAGRRVRDGAARGGAWRRLTCWPLVECWNVNFLSTTKTISISVNKIIVGHNSVKLYN